MKTYAKHLTAILVTTFTTALLAQEKVEQRPIGSETEAIEARPEGGFSKSISGKWDCGDFGTMTLNDKKGRVTGTYTYKKGSVTGTVKNGVFRGRWKQGKGRANGTFEFIVSTERKTPKPTNLRGKWKKQGEEDWEETPWECEK